MVSSVFCCNKTRVRPLLQQGSSTSTGKTKMRATDQRRILILGATGRTGKHLLNQALNRGLEVTALVRNADKLTAQDRLSVIEGLPTELEDLRFAAQGCSAILSALNISRRNDFPWAPLRTPTRFLSQVSKNLISVAKPGNRRVVVCSAWGVAETRGDIPSWFRWLIEHSNIGPAYDDQALHLDVHRFFEATPAASATAPLKPFLASKSTAKLHESGAKPI